MREGPGQFDAAAASLVDWWIGAGLDVLVDEAPRDWLRPAAPSPATIQPAAVPATVTLDALTAQFATAPLPGIASTAKRVIATGQPGAPLMLLGDVPGDDDCAEGQPFAGECGRLLDAMLAAIGWSREETYLALISPARPPGGRIDDALQAALLPLARARLALARPRVLLLLGDCASRMMLDLDGTAARGRLHALNHDGGTVTAIATLHPRTLLSQPTLKAESWKDLRRLRKALA